jgi:hydroxymethylglutaryl-CoA reductase (NADPH)
MVIGYSLGRLAGRISLYPIETIVTFFVLTTLAYFHVLSAIKNSHFFTPIHSTSRPLFAKYNPRIAPIGSWSFVDENDAAGRLTPAVEIVQLQLSIPGQYHTLEKQVTTEVINKYVPYEAVCHTINATGSSSKCLTSIRPEAYTFTFDPSKAPSAAASFAHALLGTASLDLDANADADDGSGTAFEVVRIHESIADMKSGKWVAYAGRALVVRFWSLAKVRDCGCMLLLDSHSYHNAYRCPVSHLMTYPFCYLTTCPAS